MIAPGIVEEKFKELVFESYDRGLTPTLRQDNGHFILRFFIRPAIKKVSNRRNILLFAVTLLTIFLAGYYLWTTNELWSKLLMPMASPYAQAALFTVCLISIIGVHEMAHKLTCDFHKIKATFPFFVPGPPPFGTFGAVISLKSPPINRNQLFDLGISGPIAGFIATIIVGILSILTSTMISESQLAELGGMVGPVTWPSSPLLFLLITHPSVSSLMLHVPKEMTPILGQVIFAAWIGSLLTFLNTLPIWQLDGGHVARAVLGPKGHKMASVVGLGVLFFSGFWVFALLLLFFIMVGRRSWAGVEPLDDVSPLSNSRKMSFFILLVISALCFSPLVSPLL